MDWMEFIEKEREEEASIALVCTLSGFSIDRCETTMKLGNLIGQNWIDYFGCGTSKNVAAADRFVISEKRWGRCIISFPTLEANNIFRNLNLQIHPLGTYSVLSDARNNAHIYFYIHAFGVLSRDFRRRLSAQASTKNSGSYSVYTLIEDQIACCSHTKLYVHFIFIGIKYRIAKLVHGLFGIRGCSLAHSNANCHYTN